MRFLNGVKIPAEAVVCTPPDVRRANGYYRLLNIVEKNAHDWVEFGFESQRVSKRVKYRILTQLHFGPRYDIIQAGSKIFIRLKSHITPVMEAGTDGNIRKDAGALSNSQ